LCEVALANQALQTLELLLSIAFVGAALLEDLDVVLSVLVVEGSSRFLCLLQAVSVGILELGGDGVESFDGAAGDVETAADGAVRAGVSVDELDEVLLGAGTLVRERLGGALLEVLDGGVGLDALLFGDGLAVGRFGVDLRDQDAGLSCEVVGEGFPGRSQALAVYMPQLAICSQ
jgi:hypothetical protein